MLIFKFISEIPPFKKRVNDGIIKESDISPIKVNVVKTATNPIDRQVNFWQELTKGGK